MPTAAWWRSSAWWTGRVHKGQRIKMMATGATALVEDLGYRTPHEVSEDHVGIGEVGFVVTGLKDPSEVKVGDTITAAEQPAAQALSGYRDVKPMVFTGLFPIEGDQYEPLKDALEKLKLNDPALLYEPETSHALGFGFRVGFLGLLHMEVVKERLEREFNLDLIATAPSVEYHVFLRGKGKDMLSLHSPQDMPDFSEIDHIGGLKARIMVPPDYVGAVMDLTVAHRVLRSRP